MLCTWEPQADPCCPLCSAVCIDEHVTLLQENCLLKQRQAQNARLLAEDPAAARLCLCTTANPTCDSSETTMNPISHGPASHISKSVMHLCTPPPTTTTSPSPSFPSPARDTGISLCQLLVCKCLSAGLRAGVCGTLAALR